MANQYKVSQTRKILIPYLDAPEGALPSCVHGYIPVNPLDAVPEDFKDK